jgi:hypothetical protein
MVIFLVVKLKGGGSKEPGELKVSSNPSATVFINNQSVGKTPYDGKHPAGQYTLKLVPESTVGTIVSWEGQVSVNASLLTYVNRDLADSDVTSSGDMLTLESIAGKGAEISVVSTPDGAMVTIDGKERDVTPLVIRDLPAGSYDVSVSAIGAVARTLKIKTTAGYKLNAVFNLASTGGTAGSASPSPLALTSPSPSGGSPNPSASTLPKGSVSPKPSASGSGGHTTPPAKPYVEILDTPTGFLRVRDTAGSGADEVGRVNPGEFYSLLDEQTVSGTPWYKIEYVTGKEGWVSGQYAKKTE